MTHICVHKFTIIGSDNGLSPGRRQAIIWTNAGILLTGHLGAKFSEILIKIYTFSFKKMHMKMSSGKWRPFCLGLNVLNAVCCWRPCWFKHHSFNHKGDHRGWRSWEITFMYRWVKHWITMWPQSHKHNITVHFVPTLILIPKMYRQVSNISHTWEGNKIVDHSDAVGASPVGAAPTTSSLST